MPGTEWEDPTPLIKKLLSSYRRTIGRQGHPLEEFRYVHAARKVVGVGSVGTRSYLLLLMGRDADPLFLQVKEANASVLERFLGTSSYQNHGERVVVGQRLMQGATDIFLGWQRIRGIDGVTRDYYVRQFHDWKGGVNVDNLEVHSATFYARLCAAALARAHARWGDRIAISSYLGKGDIFDKALADFSDPLCRPERARLRRLHCRGQIRATERPNGGLGGLPAVVGSARRHRTLRPDPPAGRDLLTSALCLVLQLQPRCPSPDRSEERQHLMVDSNSPRSGALPGASQHAATAPAAGPPAPDPVALIRSRQYITALVLAALLGIPISAIAYGFLALVAVIQRFLFFDLPNQVFGRPTPAWWPVPWLVLCGLLTALTIRYLPGNGGHSPAFGFQTGGRPAAGRSFPGSSWRPGHAQPRRGARARSTSDRDRRRAGGADRTPAKKDAPPMAHDDHGIGRQLRGRSAPCSAPRCSAPS